MQMLLHRPHGSPHFGEDAPDAAGEHTDLHELRLQTVCTALANHESRSVLDLGCGDGELLVRLSLQAQFEHIVGIDICPHALGAARHRLTLQANAGAPRIDLMQASFCEADESLRGFDAGVMLETIEHVTPAQLSRVEQAVFGCFRPALLLVTTPNQEYNVLHGLAPGAFRHPGHHFEWSRARFRHWARGVAQRNRYGVRFTDIGPLDPLRGASTQMATFMTPKTAATLCSPSAESCLPGINLEGVTDDPT